MPCLLIVRTGAATGTTVIDATIIDAAVIDAAVIDAAVTAAVTYSLSAPSSRL